MVPSFQWAHCEIALYQFIHSWFPVKPYIVMWAKYSGISISLNAASNSPQKIWIFPFAQYIVTQGNNLGHFGEGLYILAVVSPCPSPLAVAVYLWELAPLWKLGKGIVVFLWGS